MRESLPDVSLTELAPAPGPLEWVGMQGIFLPVNVAEPGYRRTLHASADVQVDLPAADVKGIHMSRLYRLLDALGDGDALSPAALAACLQEMVESHRDCGTGRARMRLNFDFPVRRAALITEGLAGWKAYPVRLDAVLAEGAFSLRAQVTVIYSSTCPCSAALSRQLIEQGFNEAFAGEARVDASSVAAWLRQNATLATPHSQRSEAVVAVGIAADAADFGLLALIDRIEEAVGTAVQTAVRRADEQAFAARNGQNLMFVEDAARRIKAAVSGAYDRPAVHVRHLESLHPHDAAAWAGPDR